MPSHPASADTALSQLSSSASSSVPCLHDFPAPLCPQEMTCIVTAAGLSSRMGAWKMMLPWGNGTNTLLDTSLYNALHFCHHIILVTGYRGAELAARYQSVSRIQILHNPDFEAGLLSSQRLAAQAVSTHYCFLTHGDVPFLTPDIWQQLWALRSDAALLPRYKQVPGHPVLLSRDCLLNALALPEGSNMKKRLLAGPHHFLDMQSDAVVTDIDTRDVYQQYYRV